MQTTWIENYILLVLRMDRAFSQVDTSFFLDTYYGPEELKVMAMQEPAWSFAQLASQAEKLLDRLPEEGYPPRREEFLRKHVIAMLTIAQVRSGTEMPFFVEVGKVFDLEPIWIPEEELERSMKLMDEALPGKGDLRARYHSWLKSMQLPAERWEQVLPIMKDVLSEVRRRTKSLVELPDDDGIDIVPVKGVNYGAANWYQGGYRSRLELNMDRPVYSFGLLYQMCHESYPGHHTESCMKEKTIFRGQGQLEQSVFFALGPQLVICEGIAVVAPQMIFTFEEAAQWMRENINPLLGPQAQEVDLEKMLEAYAVISPDDLGSNLATLIEAGRSEENVLEYALAYSPYSEEQVRQYLMASMESRLSRLYSFSYSQGSRLIRPLLKSANRATVIRRLLTEQFTPGMLSSLAG